MTFAPALFWLALDPHHPALSRSSRCLRLPLPRMARYRIISGWSRIMLWLPARLCGIR